MGDREAREEGDGDAEKGDFGVDEDEGGVGCIGEEEERDEEDDRAGMSGVLDKRV